MILARGQDRTRTGCAARSWGLGESFFFAREKQFRRGIRRARTTRTVSRDTEIRAPSSRAHLLEAVKRKCTYVHPHFTLPRTFASTKQQHLPILRRPPKRVGRREFLAAFLIFFFRNAREDTRRRRYITTTTTATTRARPAISSAPTRTTTLGCEKLPRSRRDRPTGRCFLP